MDYSDFTVLLVDDEQIHRSVLQNILGKELQLQCREAESSQQAIEMLAGEQPDILVLDMTMPVMNGMTLLKKLRANPATHDLPVIACTAISSKRLLVELIQQNVADYILKPYARSTIVEKFRVVLDKLIVARAKNNAAAPE